jgi:putative glutamine amidotransferase
MKAPPLILITASQQQAGEEFADASVSLSNAYTRAIAAAGGVPWVAPGLALPGMAAEMVRRADGVVLTGGADVQPSLYRARLPVRLRRTVSPPEEERDLFEMQVITEVFRRGKPLLAICRGLQILNVSLGGTLVLDIKSQVTGALKHQCMDQKDTIVHDVALTGGSLLARIAGKSVIGVNSSHHQAVEQVGKGLQVSAQSADGVIEGMELEPAGREHMPFLVGVQFHPERLSAEHRPHRAMFESFVGACALAGRESL